MALSDYFEQQRRRNTEKWEARDSGQGFSMLTADSLQPSSNKNGSTQQRSNSSNTSKKQRIFAPGIGYIKQSELSDKMKSGEIVFKNGRYSRSDNVYQGPDTSQTIAGTSSKELGPLGLLEYSHSSPVASPSSALNPVGKPFTALSDKGAFLTREAMSRGKEFMKSGEAQAGTPKTDYFNGYITDDDIQKARDDFSEYEAAYSRLASGDFLSDDQQDEVAEIMERLREDFPETGGSELTSQLARGYKTAFNDLLREHSQGSYVGHALRTFGAGAVSPVQNIESGLKTALGDLGTNGGYSDGYKTLENYFGTNPQMLDSAMSQGGSVNIVSPAVSQIQRETGLDKDIIQSYLTSVMSDYSRNQINRQYGNGLSDFYKNTASDWIYMTGAQVVPMLMSAALPVSGTSSGTGIIGNLIDDVARAKASGNPLLSFSLSGVKNTLKSAVRGNVATWLNAASSGGSTLTQNARENGFDPMNYSNALLNSFAESFTEGLFGISDAQSVSKIFTTQAGKKGAVNILKNIGRYLATGAEEGLEEIVNVPLSGLSDKLTTETDKPLVGKGGVFDLSQMLRSGLDGAVVGLILGSFGAVSAATGQSQSQDVIDASIDELYSLAKEYLPPDQAPPPPESINAESLETYKSQLVTAYIANADYVNGAALSKMAGEPISETIENSLTGNIPSNQEMAAVINQALTGIPAADNGENVPSQLNNQIDSAAAGEYNNTIGGGLDVREGDQLHGASGTGVWGRQNGTTTDSTVEIGRVIGRGDLLDSVLVSLSPQSRDILSKRGDAILELNDSSGESAAFSFALDAARNADFKHGWAVTPKSAEELSAGNVRLYMTKDGSAGFGVTPDGDIVAVFANKAAGAPKGSAYSMMPLAIAAGGSKLDCYGDKLVSIYSQFGFIPVARVKFNPEFANPGWTPDKGTPDIYFMMHNGDDPDTVVRNRDNYPIYTSEELHALPEMDYEQAMQYRDGLLAQRTGQGGNGGSPGSLTETRDTSDKGSETVPYSSENAAQSGTASDTTAKLEGLVKDGTLTEEQAQAVSQTLIGQKNTASLKKADTSIIEKLKNSIPSLRDMEPVSNITGNEIPETGSITDRLMQFVSSFGGKVRRAGFGDVLFSKGKIKNSMVGHGVGNTKIETFAAVPEVISKGRQIDHQSNWKGRKYDTYLFAAPVTYRGKPTYVGVVVMKDSASGRYYLHEAVDTDGNIILRDNEKPRRLHSDRLKVHKGQADTVADAGASDTNVSHKSTDVKSTTGGRTRERGFTKNIATDMNMEEELRIEYRNNPEIYKQLSNSETLSKAEEIFRKGISEARRTVEEALYRAQDGYKLKPEIVPLTRMVANTLTRHGDSDTGKDMLSSLAIELTEAGQFTQAGAILRNADPATVLLTINKKLKRINDNIPKSGRKQTWEAKLTEAEKDLIFNTDFTQDGAYTDVYSQIADRLGREMPATLWEKLTEIRRVAMLLNPKTMVRNLTGNVPMWGMDSVSDRMSGALQELLIKDKADRTRTFYVSPKSKEIARELYEQNLEVLRGNKWDISSLLRDHRKYFSGTAINRITEDTPALQAATIRFFDKLGSGADNLRSFTYSLLEKGDSPFVKAAFIRTLSQNIQAQGYNNASEVPQAVIDRAVDQAFRATFKDASETAKWLNSLKNKKAGGILDVLFPFTTTPINIGKRTVEYSPLGIINAFTANDAASRIDALSRSLTGSGVVALGFLLYRLGILTAGADEDEDKRAWDRATGNAPYSLFGKYTYDWAQPTGTLMAIGAEIADSIENSDKEWGDAALNAIYVGGDSILNMTFFQSLVDLLKGYGNISENIAETVTSSFLSQLVPSVVGAAARTADDTVRSTRGEGINEYLAPILAKIPGLSDSLPPSVNIRGEEQKRIDNPLLRALTEFASPANVNTGTLNNVDGELQRLYDATGTKTIFPSVADSKFDFGDTSYPLTGNEYADFQKTQGRTFYDTAESLISSPSYDMLTDAQKVKILSDLVSYSKDSAKRSAVGDKYTSEWDFENQLGSSALGEYLIYKRAWNDMQDEQNAGQSGEDTETFSELASIYKHVSAENQDEFAGDLGSGFKNIMTALNNGITVDQWYDAKNKFESISDDSNYSNATERATAFSNWLDAETDFTTTQKDIVKDSMTYFSHIPAQAEAYDNLKNSGLSHDDAYSVVDAINHLEPEEGKTNVSSTQKIEAISNLGMSDENKLSAIRHYASDSMFEKYTAAYDEFAPISQITYFFTTLDSLDENGYPDQEEVREALDYSGMTYSQREAVWKTYWPKTAY